MPKSELSRLREKHAKLWREQYEIGQRIHELEATAPKPSDRVQRESEESWALTFGILKKAGVISVEKWEDLPDEQKRVVYAFHKIRRDVREAIAKALRVRYVPRGW